MQNLNLLNQTLHFNKFAEDWIAPWSLRTTILGLISGNLTFSEKGILPAFSLEAVHKANSYLESIQKF